MIINSLIDKVYVYDTTLTIVFNTQDKDLSTKMPDISELEKLFSSFYGNNECSYLHSKICINHILYFYIF